MLTVNKYRETLLAEFYLAEDDITVHRSKNGYHNRFKKGDVVVGFQSKQGYLRLQVPRARCTVSIAHLVTLLRGIPIPNNLEIDHIDGDVTNNARDNLRIVNRQTNSKNRKRRSDNKSGISGIHWSQYHNHYVIRRTVNNKRISRSAQTLEQSKIVLAELHAMDIAYTERHGK